VPKKPSHHAHANFRNPPFPVLAPCPSRSSRIQVSVDLLNCRKVTLLARAQKTFFQISIRNNSNSMLCKICACCTFSNFLTSQEKNITLFVYGDFIFRSRIFSSFRVPARGLDRENTTLHFTHILLFPKC